MKEIRPFLIIGSAILTFLSYPPFHLGPLIFVALVPLLYAIEELEPASAFKWGYLWGLIYYLGLVYYIAWTTIPGMIATVMIMSLLPASAFWSYIRLFDKYKGLAVIFIPAYFLTWQWLLTLSEFNYPWTDFGYALAYMLPLIQAADMGGVYLITLFVVAVNLLVYVSISSYFHYTQRGRFYLRLYAVILIAVFFIYGEVRLSHAERSPRGESLTVGLLQANMTRDIKWSPAYLQMNFDRYFALSREVAQKNVQFIIWPETAIPAYLCQVPQEFAQVRNLVDSLGIPLLTGVPYYETRKANDYIYYNSAILIKPGTTGYTMYSKKHLVPMSERIPYVDKFPFLRDLNLGWGDFTPGKQMTIFNLDGYKFGTLICFESVFPGYARQFARQGAQFLVVITNDMWFGQTSLYEQHAMMAVFRAIESRIPVVRAANTGISLAVDKWGNILDRTDTFKEEYLVAKIYPERSNSAYNKIGNVVPQCGLIIALISIVVVFWRPRRYIKETL